MKLEFRPYDDSLASCAGVYIRTLDRFEQFIDYVGTAGEGPDSSFGTRFAQHEVNSRTCGLTYLKLGEQSGSYRDFLNVWMSIASEGFPSSRIHIPEMPASYPHDAEESMRV